MKKTTLTYILSAVGLFFWGCDQFIEPSIAHRKVTAKAPFDGYQSQAYAVNFWWDGVDNALDYQLQVVRGTFDQPAALTLDTTVTPNRFAFNFAPGKYQWRVQALNGSTQTGYTEPRGFIIQQASITNQSVILSYPANNYQSSLTTVALQWGALYGATQYQLEIDTNNFANENILVVNQALPGENYRFIFPKNQTYLWRVRAKNDTGQSQWSSVYAMTYNSSLSGKINMAKSAEKIARGPATGQHPIASRTSESNTYANSGDPLSWYNNYVPRQTNALSRDLNATCKFPGRLHTGGQNRQPHYATLPYHIYE